MSGLNGCRVLLVDDEPLLVIELRSLVEDLGCEVAGTAGDVASALELAKGADFDVAVLDVKLRDVTVHPVAEAVMSRGIPIVFVTGYGPDAFHSSSITIAKPIDPADLREALEKALKIIA